MTRATTVAPLPEPRPTPWGEIRSAPFAADDALPAEAEVVVIGGGLNGLMTAWHLARRGVPVTLCEKAEIGGEASGRAFGWISELLLDPVKMELCRQSKAGWEEVQRLCGETGYRVDGLCYVADRDEEMDAFAQWLESVRGAGDAATVLLGSDGVAARLPGATRRWRGGICAPSDGGAEPRLAAAAVARSARSLGAKIVQHCAVRSLELEAGRVAGVITERGTVRTRIVLFAGNAWSRLFCGNLGVDVPQLYVLMSMGRVEGVKDGPPGCGGQDDWAWRRQIDGGYSLGNLRGQRVPVTRDCIQLFSRFVPAMKAERRNVRPSLGADARADWGWRRRWTMAEPAPFERHRLLDPHVDQSVPRASLGRIGRIFPAFAGARLAETWAGAITVTPDNMPIASAVDRIPGFFLLTGCSYGMTWSPTLGRMMADLMTGREPSLDPDPYRLGRFFDGTRLILRH